MFTTMCRDVIRLPAGGPDAGGSAPSHLLEMRLRRPLHSMLPAPGEPDDRKIVVRVLLFDALEQLPQLAKCHEEAQPLAVVTVALLLQNVIDLHGVLLSADIRNTAALWCGRSATTRHN